jgi:predicted transcriptional regulator
MNIGRTIVHHIAINEIRRNDILEILKDGPKTAYEISLKMPVFYSTGTTLYRLRELQAAKRVTNFGDLWEIWD